MKTLKLVLLTIGLIFLISCNKEETEINSNLIIGGWKLEKVSFNNIDGTEINDWISKSTLLNFDDNESYYRNYITGNWSVSEMQLKLVPKEELRQDDWNYEILQKTEN